MFSSTIRIASVNDYIAPSQECIKPLMANGKLKLDDQIKPDLIKNKDNIAKVSLQDCLACSGCITTAETILIESQSKQEFLNSISKFKHPLIGISPQSLSSLAYKFNLSDSQMFSILNEFFKKLNVTLSDLSVYWKLAIEQCKQEFITNNKNYPILCSECPGWACYAEKTLDESIIQQMSKVKSPQQIFGLMNRQSYDYIVTIMPCFDKKLEAVRQENANEINLVLSTKEVEELVQDFVSVQQSEMQFENRDLEVYLLQDKKEFHNPTSYGYLDWIVQAYIEQNKLVNYQILSKQRRNVDFIEIFIKQEDQIIAQFARIYGLKNIANLVQQLKSNNCKYLYVEIMACPQGCLNGGGQIKQDKKSSELISKLQTLMIEDKSFCTKEVITQDKLITSFKAVPKEQQFHIEW